MTRMASARGAVREGVALTALLHPVSHWPPTTLGGILCCIVSLESLWPLVAGPSVAGKRGGARMLTAGRRETVRALLVFGSDGDQVVLRHW